MPNIYGHFDTAQYDGYKNCSGAFTASSANRTYQTGEYGGTRYTLNASSLNSIYADNSSVLPKSLTLNYMIKG